MLYLSRGASSEDQEAKKVVCLDLPNLDSHSPLGYQSDVSVRTNTSRSSSTSRRASLDSTSLSLHPVTVEQAHSQVLQNITHAQQRYNWDCGLTCVLMILNAMDKLSVGNQPGEALTRDPHTRLRSLASTASIWTIDLAHLLSRFGLDVCYMTTTLGPNPAFANEGFYMPHMQEDERRVERLFREASSAGIVLQKRSLPPEGLKEAILTAACLVIALVDKRKMDHSILQANRSHYDAAIASLPTSLAIPTATDIICSAGISAGIEGYNAGYLGHYVLIVGYDGERDEYVLRDPAQPSGSSTDREEGDEDDVTHGLGTRISASAFEESRRSFGTDEDLIIVPLHNACPPYPWVSSSLAAKVHSHQLIDLIDA